MSKIAYEEEQILVEKQLPLSKENLILNIELECKTMVNALRFKYGRNPKLTNMYLQTLGSIEELAHGFLSKINKMKKTGSDFESVLEDFQTNLEKTTRDLVKAANKKANQVFPNIRVQTHEAVKGVRSKQAA